MDMGSGMDMGSSPSNSTSLMMMTMMTPYLHFTGGDYLYFEPLHPSSAGAIAGASIFLVFLAILERLLNAARSSLEVYWRKRAILLTSRINGPGGPGLTRQLTIQSFPKNEDMDVVTYGTSLRTIPPFIAAHDIPRGIIYAFQAFLLYALMIAIMTFQAAYVISIIVGLGLGEVIFGRFCAGRLHSD
ncbi:hypothetical protein AX15_005693 [Amanita polypyramis BW_CC]|nr:hypothetical protein AX15_005693 [Amanita polypyramis BW_CC]